MKVTLTRDLPPHKKGTTREVTPAVARRLIAKGAAEKVKAQTHSRGDDNAPHDDAASGKPDGNAPDGPDSNKP